MATGKRAIELIDQQTTFAKVGEHFGGKGTTGSADSRERQSRKRKADTIKAVYSTGDDRRVGAAKTAPKKNRTQKMYQGSSSPKNTKPKVDPVYGPQTWTKKPNTGTRTLRKPGPSVPRKPFA